MTSTARRYPDLHEQARIDGGLVNSLFGQSDDGFWPDTYVGLIQRVKVMARITGIDEPSLQKVSQLAATPNDLRKLVEQAETCASTVDDRKTVDEIRAWFSTTWLKLTKGTRAAVVAHVALIGDSQLEVMRINGPATGQTEPLGNRTGPWNDWSTETLPEHLQSTIHRIMAQGPAQEARA